PSRRPRARRLRPTHPASDVVAWANHDTSLRRRSAINPLIDLGPHLWLQRMVVADAGDEDQSLRSFQCGVDAARVIRRRFDIRRTMHEKHRGGDRLRRVLRTDRVDAKASKPLSEV